jgi:hypothetical protein
VSVEVNKKSRPNWAAYSAKYSVGSGFATAAIGFPGKIRPESKAEKIGGEAIHGGRSAGGARGCQS